MDNKDNCNEIIILHICCYSVRFLGSEGYYNYFRNAFPHYKQVFYLINSNDLQVEKNDIVEEDRSLCKLSELISNSDIIIMHSLDGTNLRRLKLIWSCQKKYDKKFIWLIWGHDLYDAYIDAHRIRGLRPRFFKIFFVSQIKEYYRKRIIENLDCICGIKGDCVLASKYYKTNARLVPYNQINYGTPKPIGLPFKESNMERINVMLCNHMDKHCRYIETIQRLSEIDNGKINIYVQAAGYGREIPYVKEVMFLGEKLFHNRFYVDFDWMNYEEICQRINDMDVGIFNIDRQMGQGTAILFAYYGKKVYFSKENTNMESFMDDGIEVFRFESIDKDSFYKMPDSEFMNKNRTTVNELFEERHFREIWERILGLTNE